MFLPGNWISAMGHFDLVYTGDTHNLIHELVFALIVGIAGVGLFSQLWKPKENFTGQLVALIIWSMMILFAVITNNWVPQPLYIIFGGLTLIATILHPVGFGLFNWIRTAKTSKILFVLVVIVAIPLLVFAFTNINSQITNGEGSGFFHKPPVSHSGLASEEPVNDIGSVMGDSETEHDEQEHSNAGHYRNMAIYSFIIILVGFLASFKPRGWRIAAWIAGLLPVLLGIASIVLPEAESSLGLAWGITSIVWGVSFIAMAEFTQRNNNISIITNT